MFKNILILTAGILILSNLNILAKETGNGRISSFLQTNLPDDKELPLTVIPAEGNADKPVFFLISGDGGWTTFDNAWCEQLAKKGVPVVGIDAKKYFWKAKTPDETTSALAPVIENYTKKWNRTSIVLAGYSFGADIVPFITNRLPEALRKRTSLILLLSPDRYGDFEIHLTDMLSLGIAKKRYNIANEVKKITVPPVVSIFGQDEAAIDIQTFKEAGSKISLLPGDHHYNKNVAALTEMILKLIAESLSKSPQK